MAGKMPLPHQEAVRARGGEWVQSQLCPFLHWTPGRFSPLRLSFLFWSHGETLVPWLRGD